MKYKGKELEAFDVGLHLIVLLMNAMIKDIQTGEDKDE